MKKQFENFSVWLVSFIVDKFYKFVHTVFGFFGNIKKMIEWFPIIWNNHDWDQFYIYEILEYKLKRVSKYLTESEIVDSSEQLPKINRAVELIGILKDEKYFDEAFKEYYDKYPIEQYPILELEDKVLEDGKTHRVLKDSVQDRELWNACLNKEGFLYNNYKKVLYGILENNLDYWWE